MVDGKGAERSRFLCTGYFVNLDNHVRKFHGRKKTKPYAKRRLFEGQFPGAYKSEILPHGGAVISPDPPASYLARTKQNPPHSPRAPTQRKRLPDPPRFPHKKVREHPKPLP